MGMGKGMFGATLGRAKKEGAGSKPSEELPEEAVSGPVSGCFVLVAVAQDPTLIDCGSWSIRLSGPQFTYLASENNTSSAHT